MTFSVTVITTGKQVPVIVTSTSALYCPTGRLVGFTPTLKVAGRLPPSGLAVSQNMLLVNRSAVGRIAGTGLEGDGLGGRQSQRPFGN